MAALAVFSQIECEGCEGEEMTRLVLLILLWLVLMCGYALWAIGG